MTRIAYFANVNTSRTRTYFLSSFHADAEFDLGGEELYDHIPTADRPDHQLPEAGRRREGSKGGLISQVDRLDACSKIERALAAPELRRRTYASAYAYVHSRAALVHPRSIDEEKVVHIID